MKHFPRLVALEFVLTAVLLACGGADDDENAAVVGSGDGGLFDGLCSSCLFDSGGSGLSDSGGSGLSDSGGSGGATTGDLDCDGGRFDKATGLCWQDPSGGLYPWDKAVSYCDNLVLTGHDDWRLPSRQDFIELLGGCDSEVLREHEGYCNSCAASTTCSALFGSDDKWYWSSSSYAYYTDNAWFVGFDDGYVSYYDKSYASVARCVRGGP